MTWYKIDVEVLEEELIQSMIKPLPHVAIFMHPANTAWRIRHWNSIKFTKCYRNAILNDVLIVKELPVDITETEESENVEGFEWDTHDDEVDVKEMKANFSDDEPEGKSQNLQQE